MQNFIKQNWFKLSLIIIFILILGFGFYWFQLRPVQIKHDCSWVKKHSDAIIEVTQEQYNKCCEDNPQDKEYFSNSYSCFHLCELPRSAQPAKDWWEPASKIQYDFCIHEKGL